MRDILSDPIDGIARDPVTAAPMATAMPKNRSTQMCGAAFHSVGVKNSARRFGIEFGDQAMTGSSSITNARGGGGLAHRTHA